MKMLREISSAGKTGKTDLLLVQLAFISFRAFTDPFLIAMFSPILLTATTVQLQPCQLGKLDGPLKSADRVSLRRVAYRPNSSP